MNKEEYCEKKCDKILEFFYDFDDVSTPQNISPNKIINSCKNYCIQTNTITQKDYKKPLTLAEEMGIIIAEEYISNKTNQQQKD